MSCPYKVRKRLGARMFWGSKADLRRCIRAESGRGAPQTFTKCLRAVGHHGMDAEADSREQSWKMAAEAWARRGMLAALSPPREA